MNYKNILILPSMTTTFFFDLFGVLLGADKSTLLHFIAKRTGNTYEKAEHIFSKYFPDFEKSKISFSGFFQKIQYSLNNGEQLNIEEFKSTWMNQDLAELPTVDYLEILSKNHSVNLISNVSDSYLDRLKTKFEFFNFFDHTITSEQAGYSKPSPGIFKYSLNLAGAKPASSVFIDDQMSNVKSAENLGFKIHHFTEFNTFKSFISDYV